MTTAARFASCVVFNRDGPEKASYRRTTAIEVETIGGDSPEAAYDGRLKTREIRLSQCTVEEGTAFGQRAGGEPQDLLQFAHERDLAAVEMLAEAASGLAEPVDDVIPARRGWLLAALETHPDQCVLVGAYALGKAQRVIAELRAAGHHAPIYLHGAMEKMCRLYEEHGVDLGELRLVADHTKDEMRGSIIIAPPSALSDRWSRRLPDPITAMASGWMRVRQRARQRGVELPLVISDHADWNELTQTITEVTPAETWITHGREEALLRWCELNQRRARALALVGREDEDE